MVAVPAPDIGTVLAAGEVGAVAAGVVAFAAAELAVAVVAVPAFEPVAAMVKVVLAVVALLAAAVFATAAPLGVTAVERAGMVAPAVVAPPAVFDRVARGGSGPVVVVVVSAGRLSWPGCLRETKTEIEKG